MEDLVIEARSAFEDLSEDDKLLVTKLYVLTNAETKITDLKAAKAVDDLIDAIGEVTSLDQEPQVLATVDAGRALNNTQ